MSPEDVEIVFFVMCMKYEVTLDYLNVFQLPICRVDFKLLFKKKKKKKEKKETRTRWIFVELL